MRADRLLMIMTLLQTHRQLSSRELAERLEVSERTVHRDMEALSNVGIPVYSERGSKGGWLLTEGYRNQITGLTTSEIRALLLLQSSSVVNDLGLNEQTHSALRKLLSALPSALRRDAEFVRERIHIDGAGWHSTAPTRDSLLEIVQEAIWAERSLHIAYRRWDSGEDAERIVHPFGLVAKKSVWYLVARSESEDELRTYRISRLKNASMTSMTFVRPPTFDLAAYWEQSTELFKANLPRYPARVRISIERWDQFAQERYVSLLVREKTNDGKWFEADVAFNTEESARQILLGYGRHAQALSPESLRNGIYEENKAAILLYEGGFKLEK